jgi:DNA uptake protein ComE-like DNA-binding protein
MCAEERLLSIRLAQKILNEREKLCGFRDLKQVATVPGIGLKNSM